MQNDPIRPVKPTAEMIEAGWKAGIGLNKLQVERILVAALAVAPPEDDVTAIKRLANSVGMDFKPHQKAKTTSDPGVAVMPASPLSEIDAGIDDHEQPRYTTRRLHAEMKRAREQGRQEVVDELRGTCVAVLPRSAFQVRDHVEKYTGDYHAKGEVRGIFAMTNGAIRYVVEHPAEGGGSFCHIYSEKNLRKVEP